MQDTVMKMDIKHGSEESAMFVTGVGLITTNGRWGHDVMTAEWVHQVSYSPALVMVNVDDSNATADNIKKSKEFGVSIASVGQAAVARIAGSYTGKETDKMAILRELGTGFYKAKKIDAYMLKGAALNLELKLIKQEKVGDHVMFIGEVIGMSASSDAKPLAFRSGQGFYALDENRIKSGVDAQKLEKLAMKYSKE
jgi:flavin reductase (DIM6/NTAB) family NADH-FMN oxidoreductase RutF